jgi:hypothetical protein
VHAVRISAAGKPFVERSVAIPTPNRDWAGAAWAAIDPSLRYFGVTSGYDNSADQTVTVVDTRTFTAHQLSVQVQPVGGKYSEVQVTFGGRPSQVVVAAGGLFQTFPLADVLAGRTVAATSSAPLGAGNHGPVVSRSGDRHFSTTADGVDGAGLPGSRLTGPTSVPYSTARDVVLNARPRWAADDRTIWGAASENTGLAPEQWADTRNVVHVLDTATSRSTLTRLPDGVAGRLALSSRYAAVTTLSPEGGRHDAAGLRSALRDLPPRRRHRRAAAAGPGTGPRPAHRGHPDALDRPDRRRLARRRHQWRRGAHHPHRHRPTRGRPRGRGAHAAVRRAPHGRAARLTGHGPGRPLTGP